MAVEKETKEALTYEEALEKGFFGVVANAYPNDLHHFDNENLRAETFQTAPENATPQPGETTGQTAKGAKVNTDDSPTPSGGRSGPGANTDTSQDDKNK